MCVRGESVRPSDEDLFVVVVVLVVAAAVVVIEESVIVAATVLVAFGVVLVVCSCFSVLVEGN